MGGGHAHPSGLHHPGDSVLHRLPAEAKVLAVLATILAIVATPREAFWAFGLYLLLLVAIAVAARLPLRFIGRRIRIEVPFLAFALFLPIVGTDPRVDVLGVPLSEAGLWAGWNIAAKGTLGVLAAILLSASTPVVELLRGLERLRVPRVLVAIAGFMVRYLDVVTGEAGRMRVARISRGDDPRWIWQARATAATAGTLFIRSYERGERVHLAMLARGYTGSMPEVHHHHPSAGAWWTAALLPALAVGISVTAHVL
ncbi:cobalt ECF transporter T component CbiQ [Iamia majanohamensis]|uniref:Cobalt ECF transporter T component CbiQ n=1 Tax=Iamia majanohamensis TaxID=467976 RepID=A0AAE9YI55_9ACTN|nr:cobalt ECF transporter T component CbiQ [Iamia majanohamensis]WCO68276.1 cobalt ECF transporter T component CbiQ [Iamia majanohamensis]